MFGKIYKKYIKHKLGSDFEDFVGTGLHYRKQNFAKKPYYIVQVLGLIPHCLHLYTYCFQIP